MGLQEIARHTPAIVVAANDSPGWMKRRARYQCDGTADEVQWQAAIDEAQTYVASSSCVPAVTILPGTYRWAAGITAKSAPLIPATTLNNGVRVFWDATGGTAITKSVSYPGGLSYWRLTNINFRPGTGSPDVWLDVSASSIDKFLALDSLHFNGGEVQIKMAGWINAHWRDLRFDGWGQWAIQAIPGSANFLGSFRIDGFTADNAGDSGQQGFIQIDNSANSSNLGTWTVRDGRYELNASYDAAGPKAFIAVKSANPGNARVVKIHLSDITYYDVISQSGDVLIYSDTAGTTNSPSVILENVIQQGLSAVVGGTVASSFPSLPLQNTYHYLAVNPTSGGAPFVGDQVDLRASTTGTPLTLRKGAEAVNRLSVDQDAKASWSDGTNTADTNLYRGAANRLKTDDTFWAVDGIVTKTKAGTPSDADFATTPVDGTMVIDTTTSKIWVRISGTWKATAALT